MISLDALLPHVVPFVLTLFRVSGLFLYAPLLANRTLPRRFRVMLSVMFAAAMYPGLPPAWQQAPPAEDVLTLLPMVVSELLIGAFIGLIASIPVLSLDFAGFVIGHQMGLNLARSYNPELNIDSDALGQSLMLLGLAAFVAMDGLDAVFLAVARTFATIPPGGFALDGHALDALLAVLMAGFELALRVSAPSIGVILLIMIALGFMMKTMPQINVMSVGFMVKIVAGIAMLAAGMTVVHEVAGDEIGAVLRQVLDWAAGGGLGKVSLVW